MEKSEKLIVTPKWTKIKAMYDAGTNGSEEYGKNFPVGGELDELCEEFIDMLGTLTRKFGYLTTIEGIHMNLWKERIWSLVEKAGLLPEIAWRDEKEEDSVSDDAFQDIDDEFDVDDLEDREDEAWDI